MTLNAHNVNFHCPFNQDVTCFSVLTEAPFFAEPGDAIIEKVANNKVVISCPAEGTERFTDELALN